MATPGDNNPHDKGPTVNTRELVPIIKLSQQTQLNYMSDPERRHKMPPGGFKRPGGRAARAGLQPRRPGGLT